MADKQIYIKISADSAQPVAAVKAMRNELSRLEKAYNAINTSTATGAQRAQKLQKEMADLRVLIKQQEADMKKVEKVITNLSNASLSQLNQALRQVKKEMSRTSESSPKLEELRQKYKAITDQIKVMQGEMLNIKKHMGELSTQTDSWLQRAINQQKQLVESTQKTSSAYQGQVNILHQLQNEQARRAVSTISDGGASADALRTARANLVSYRDQLGKGGILPASGNVATEIERINAELKKCDDQLDAIAGKEKQIELTTDQLQQKADNIILDPKKFSPKEIKAAIDEIQKKLNNLGTNDTDRKKLNEQMKQLKNILDGVDHELVNIGDLLKPANLRKAPLETLQKAAKQLENEMAKLNRDQQQYIDKQKQLAAIRGEIERTTGAINRQGSAWKTTFRNISMYFGVFQLFSIAQQKLQGMLQSNLAYSDQLADIRKVTGLATKEVNELSDSLATLNTRSTVQDLADLAYQGGKMGFGQYGVEGMSAFVRAADQVKVALSDDLGDDSLLQISKLVDTMGLIPKLGVERSMLAVGSSINQLSATSTASGTHIVDFAKRLTGLSRITGITTPELLALGSAADALGQAPEVAATAFGKLFTSLQTNHNLIEQQLNMEKGTINNLFSQGKAMEAILQIMEKMREKGNMNALGNIWKDLGSEGQRLIGVMATMSKNVDTVRDHVDESNEAFEKATSLTNEYALKQDTANAILEKANNLWEKAFVYPGGVATVKEMAQAWYDLSETLTSSTLYMGEMKVALWMIIEAVKLLIALLPTLVEFFMFKGIATGAMALYRGFVALRASIIGATAAQVGLNAAMKANLFGLIASLVATAVGWLISYAQKADEAAESQQTVNRALADAQAEYLKLKRKLDDYVKAMSQANLAEETRRRLLRGFNRDYKEYLDKLGIEVNNVNQLRGAYEKLNAEIKKKAYFELREKTLSSYVGDAQQTQADAMIKFQKVMQKYGMNVNADYVVNNQHLGMVGAVKGVYQQAYPNAKFDNRHNNGMGRFYPAMSTDSGATWQEISLDPAGLNTKAMDQMEEVSNAVNDIIIAFRDVRTKTKEVHDAFDGLVGDWDADFKSLTESPGALDNEAPDKDAERLRKQAENDQKRAWREDMAQAQSEAKAIIDNIKNFYQRQITEVLRTANEQNWDTTLSNAAVRSVEARMNLALSQARKSIAGVSNTWEEFKTTMQEDMREQADEVGYNESQTLLDAIQKNNIDELRKKMATLSKNLNMPETAVTDAIWKNATMNEKANETAEQKQRNEINKRLLERNYTAKVDDEYTQSMETLGFFELDEKQLTDLMAGGDKAKQMIQNRTEEIYSVLMNARENIVDLYSIEDVTTEGGKNRLLSILFGPDYDKSSSELKSVFDLSGDNLKLFYDELLKYSDSYTEALKKARDERRKIIDERWKLTGVPDLTDQYTDSLNVQSKLQGVSNVNETPSMQLGFTNNIGTDPEIKAYEAKMNAARAYYDFVKASTDDQILIQEAQRKSLQAMMDYAMQVGNSVSKQVKSITEFAGPMNTMAEDIGQKFGDAIFNVESSGKRWNQIIKEMILSYAKMLINMTTQNLSMKLQQALFYKQMEMQAELHQQQLLVILMAGGMAQMEGQAVINGMKQTQLSVDNALTISKEAKIAAIMAAFGISEGAAKTIAALGIWGIPLIGIISSLLLGLLASALSSAGDDGGAASSNSGPNVKLATGMLTYDSGNVQSVSGGSPAGSPSPSGYAPSASPGGSGVPAGAAGGDRTPVLGSDGYVYQARQVPQLQTGLVTSPIATMVNGQPSLVGERGPEMVIGRETTAAMQMARPDLLAAIVKFDKNYSNGHAYRTYDEGNLSDFATVPDGSPSGEGTLTKEDIDGLRSSLSEFTAVMLAIKRNGLHVNKYGRGGIAQESQDGANFMRRNSGDRLWKG